MTISRQAGAGGRSLARSLVEVLAAQPETDVFDGWQVFDHQLCELVADDPRLAGSLAELVDESYRTGAEEFFHQLLRPGADQSYVIERVFRTVRMLAGVGKVIVVGRAGSEVTRDMSPGCRVRLVAPEAVRITRTMARDGVDERQAKTSIRRLDANRAKLLRRYFDTDIDDPEGYDATFNSAELSCEAVAHAITGILRRRIAEWPG